MKNPLKSRFFCSLYSRQEAANQQKIDLRPFQPKLLTASWIYAGSECNKFHLKYHGAAVERGVDMRAWFFWAMWCQCVWIPPPSKPSSARWIWFIFHIATSRNEMQRYLLPNEIPAKEKYRSARVCYTLWYEKTYAAKILYASVESIRHLNGKVFVYTVFANYCTTANQK